MVQLGFSNPTPQPETFDWDSRTNTLTFHTFRPVNGTDYQVLPGLTTPVGNGLKNGKTTEALLNNRNDHNNQHSNGGHKVVPPPINGTHYKRANNGRVSSSGIDTVLIQLREGDDVVGFSMCGGREEKFPTFVNQITKGTPADRAGLSIGDEITEVNGVSLRDASHLEIVEHIHECIKSRALRLKVKRRSESSQDPGVHSPVGNGGRSGVVTDAYMISIDPNDKPRVVEQLDKFHPGVKAVDMEELQLRLSAHPQPSDYSRFNGGHLPMVNGDLHVSTSTSHSKLNGFGSGDLIAETSLSNGPTQVRPDARMDVESGGHMFHRSHAGPNVHKPPVIHHHHHDRQQNLPQASQQRPAAKLSPSTTADTNVVSPRDFNDNKLKCLTDRGLTTPISGGAEPAAKAYYSADFLGHSEQQSRLHPSEHPTTPETVLSADEREKLRRYAEELKKRKDNEERVVREQEFLRSSLRGSKKLQALERQKMSGASVIEVSEPVGQLNVGYLDESHQAEVQVITADVEDVMLSVNRVTEVLDNIPEHRRDSQFLRDLFSDKEVRLAMDVNSAIAEHWCSRPTLKPVSTQSFLDADEGLRVLAESISERSGELQSIIERPHLQATLYAHDKIAAKLLVRADQEYLLNAEALGLKETVIDVALRDSVTEGQIRIVKLRKDNGLPLGATVRCEGEKIVVGRIVKGGVAEKSGMLQEGDELLEVNGNDLRGKTVNDVCDILANMSGDLTFVTVPNSVAISETDSTTQPIKHLKALFDYDPEDDMYLPCRELGLNFSKGDVLHVISTKDPNWWQAYREGEDKIQPLAGLVPSTSFQTQREQYNRDIILELEKEHKEANLLCHKKKKTRKLKPHTPAETPLGDSEEILTYDEVCLYMSRTGRRRPVVLVGPTNVGCLELRQKLMETDKDRFAGVVPHTSRPRKPGEVDGIHYWFVSKTQFQEDVTAHKFVEWGEFQKHFYGTSFDAIKNVVERGKTCVLNLRAPSLKTLRSSTLMPYIVYISPPSFERLRINKQKQNPTIKDDELRAIIQEGKETEENFGHLFDRVIVNYDLERSFQELRTVIYRLETEPQWVPSTWCQNNQNSIGIAR